MNATPKHDTSFTSDNWAGRKPDFFIIGAPKAGTTSLYAYLSTHPQIFMPRFKEPHYFSSDQMRGGGITSLTEYLSLFSNATKSHLACGEGSTGYLRSGVAVPNILALNPAARFIVILRNPVDLIYSYHSQLVRSLSEPVADFEQAWRLQEQRAQGRLVPRCCTEPADLQYRRVGMLGAQVERLLSNVPKQRVKFLLFDDLKVDPQRVYEDVLAFLDVPSDGRTEFPVENPNQIHRSKLIAKLAQNPPFPLSILRNYVHDLYCRNVRVIRWLVDVHYRLNSKAASRPPLRPGLQRELQAEFYSDLRLLERLVERDLSHWIPVTANLSAA